MRLPRLPLIAAVALVLPVIAGCGGSDSDDSGQATTATQAPTQTAAKAKTTPAAAAKPAGPTLTIRMSEFAFKPKDSVAKAGKVTISAPNDGQTIHELVVLKTDADPANLPKKGGEVDEATSVGEIPDVTPGSTKKVTLKLAAGKYALVCALPGHYEGGMYGSLTVK